MLDLHLALLKCCLWQFKVTTSIQPKNPQPDSHWSLAGISPYSQHRIICTQSWSDQLGHIDSLTSTDLYLLPPGQLWWAYSNPPQNHSENNPFGKFLVRIWKKLTRMKPSRFRVTISWWQPLGNAKDAFNDQIGPFRQKVATLNKTKQPQTMAKPCWFRPGFRIPPTSTSATPTPWVNRLPVVVRCKNSPTTTATTPMFPDRCVRARRHDRFLLESDGPNRWINLRHVKC